MPKFSYVSFTKPDVVTSVSDLVEANRKWQPIRGRIVNTFDFAGFIDRYGFKLPAGRMYFDGELGARQTAHRVIETLNRDEYRRGPSENLLGGEEDVVTRVADQIATGRPIRIVIPSFPGRPHNPSTHRRVKPDLGELYAVQRLKVIADHVRTFYPAGLQFVIILDGRAYAPFYGMTPESLHQYPRDLWSLATRIGAEDSIALVDLQELIDQRADEFTLLRESILPEIRDQWSDPAYTFRDELVDSMKLGTDTTAINAAAIQMVKYDTAEVDAHAVVMEMRAVVDERARATAFDYMTFLVTIRRMELIKRAFPDALRGTVHPKRGQYSPYLSDPLTKIAPWHGVAIIFGDGTIRTVYENAVYQNHRTLQAVYLKGDYEPFYYEELLDGEG
jgi:L-tyrosine isonitrile synthase